MRRILRITGSSRSGPSGRTSSRCSSPAASGSASPHSTGGWHSAASRLSSPFWAMLRAQGLVGPGVGPAPPASAHPAPYPGRLHFFLSLMLPSADGMRPADSPPRHHAAGRPAACSSRIRRQRPSPQATSMPRLSGGHDGAGRCLARLAAYLVRKHLHRLSRPAP